VVGEKRFHSLGVTLKILRSAEGNENRQNVFGLESDHGAFGIACGAAVRAEFIGEKRQMFQIQIVFADSLVRFSGAPRAKRNVTAYVRQIVQANRQPALNTDNIN